MRDVPARMSAIWASGDYTGANRPMARVTVQKPAMKLRQYAFNSPTETIPAADAKPEDTNNEYADFLFSSNEAPKELPNVKSVQWSRSTDQDTATCTIVFYNTRAMPLGVAPEREYDEQGFYTYNRGAQEYSSRWSQRRNGWAGLLMPDNILRTYEGYGFDATVAPERDSNLLQTGVWRIDTVAINTDGTLTCTCRDIGSLLIDQIAFPPVVPPDFYPARFSHVARSAGVHDPQLTVTRVQVNDYNSEAVYYGAQTYGTTALPADIYASVGTSNGASGLTFTRTNGVDVGSRLIDVLLHVEYSRTKATNSDNEAMTVTLTPKWEANGGGGNWTEFGPSSDSDTTYAQLEKSAADAAAAAGLFTVGTAAYTNAKTAADTLAGQVSTIKTKLDDDDDAAMTFSWPAANVASDTYQVVIAGATSRLVNTQTISNLAVTYVDGDGNTQTLPATMGGSTTPSGASWQLTTGQQNQIGTLVFPAIATSCDVVFTVDLGVEGGGEGIAVSVIQAGTATIGGGGASLGAGGLNGITFALNTGATPGSDEFTLTAAGSSNGLRVGGAATDDVAVQGHHYAEAVDLVGNDYWLSRANRTVTGPHAYEWVEATCDIAALIGVYVTPYSANYYCYVSVDAGNGWLGDQVVPYDPTGDSHDRQARIPYLASIAMDSGERLYRIVLPHVVRGAKRIRLTFGHLAYEPPLENPGDDQGLYRAGVRKMSAYAYVPQPPVPILPPAVRPAPTTHSLSSLMQDLFTREDQIGLGKPPASLAENAEIRTWTDWNPHQPGVSGWWEVYNNKACRLQADPHAGDIDSFMWAIYPWNHRQQIVEAVTATSDLPLADEEGQNPHWTLGLRFGVDGSGARTVQGIAVTFTYSNVQVHVINSGVWTEVGRKAHNLGKKMLGKRIRADITGDRLQIWFNTDGTTAWGAPFLQITDGRFGAERFGVGVAMGANNWIAAFDKFQVRTLMQSSLADAFELSPGDKAYTGRAETGQEWVEAFGTEFTGADRNAHLVAKSGQFRYTLKRNAPGGHAGAVAVDVGPSQQGLIRLRNLNGHGDTHWHLYLRCSDPSRNAKPGTDGSTYAKLLADQPDAFIRVTVYANGNVAIGARTPYGIDIADFWGAVLVNTNSTGGVERAVGNASFYAPGGAHAGPLVEWSIVEDQLTLSVDNVQIYQARSPLFWNTHYGTGFGLSLDDQWGAFDDVEVYGLADDFAGKMPYSLRDFDHYTPGYVEAGAGFRPGDYEDFTDIVKLCCAWAGFHWPSDAYVLYSDGSRLPYTPDHDDYVLGKDGVGRVWGDFESTGTGGQVDLDAGNFDKKTLQDVVNYVRDIVGYLFYVDETGGIVWRSPNIYQLGNMRGTLSGSPAYTREIPVIDETITLVSLGTTLSNASVMERVFVTNTSGSAGGAAAGWNPNPVGLRRVSGWPDENFASSAECLQMAELITIRRLFQYRQDTLRIPGYPKLQIDDQVRIFERTTSEGFYHYISGISSDMELESGEWYYDLQTHWLGVDPFQSWAFDRTELSAALQQYIAAITAGQLDNHWYENPRNAGDRSLPYYNVVLDGGTYAAGSWVNFLRAAMVAQLPGNVKVQSVAQAGLDTVTMAARAGTTVDTVRDFQASDYNILFASEISQDLANGRSAEQALATYQDYLRTRRAVSWLAVAVTVPHRRDARWTASQAAAFETARTTVNTALRSTWSQYADGLLDADQILGQDPANYLGSGLSPAGEQLLATGSATLIATVAPVQGG